MNVVLCDEADLLRRELRLGMEAAGLRGVGEAADGIEAVRIAREPCPDAFVVDLSMPGRDGLELVPILRREHPDARIVVFSGFQAARVAAVALRQGADAYLEKGSPLDDLVARVSAGRASAESPASLV